MKQIHSSTKDLPPHPICLFLTPEFHFCFFFQTRVSDLFQTTCPMCYVYSHKPVIQWNFWIGISFSKSLEKKLTSPWFSVLEVRENSMGRSFSFSAEWISLITYLCDMPGHTQRHSPLQPSEVQTHSTELEVLLVNVALFKQYIPSCW